MRTPDVIFGAFDSARVRDLEFLRVLGDRLVGVAEEHRGAIGVEQDGYGACGVDVSEYGPVLSASAEVMLTPGVVGPRIDTRRPPSWPVKYGRGHGSGVAATATRSSWYTRQDRRAPPTVAMLAGRVPAD